jgi:hypothetical protein
MLSADQIDPRIGQKMLQRLKRTNSNTELFAFIRIGNGVTNGCDSISDKVSSEKDSGNGKKCWLVDGRNRRHIVR